MALGYIRPRRKTPQPPWAAGASAWCPHRDGAFLMFRGNLLCVSLCLLHLVLPLGTSEKSLAPSSLHPPFKHLHCTEQPRPGRSSPGVAHQCWVEGRMSSLDLLAVLLLMQPRTALTFIVARARCWLVVSSVHRDSRSFPAKLLPSWAAPVCAGAWACSSPEEGLGSAAC